MKHRGWAASLALVSALAIVASACSKSSSSSGAGGGGGNAPDCNTAPGCVTIASGDPIEIGTLLAISGDVAFLGTDSQHGVVLALDHMDGTFDATPGQIDGHDIKLVNQDDGCSADGGKAGATTLAADPQIVAVIGTSCSSSALGVADKILGDKGIILLSPSNTNPGLTAEGTHNPYYFRTAHNDKIQGAVVVDFAVQNLKATTAATIHDESPYAQGLTDAFAANFEAQGGSVTDAEAINSADKDFKALLTKIAQNPPDVLYYPDFNPACALIAKQAASTSGLENTALMGSDGCADPSYIDTGGDATTGSYLSGPDLSAFKQGDFYTSEFLPAYKSQFGGAPTADFHAHAYDATNILLAAIEKVAVQNSDGSLTIQRSALRDALQATTGYEGITGTITCTPLGDCATSVTIGVYKVPAVPFNDPAAKPVFSETKTLAEVSG